MEDLKVVEEVKEEAAAKTFLKVSQPLMQALVNYLETKPHKEVHQLLVAILQECNSQKPFIEEAQDGDSK